jgi:uncharacterized repeat protein (TIGR01451 family)
MNILLNFIIKNNNQNSNPVIQRLQVYVLAILMLGGLSQVAVADLTINPTTNAGTIGTQLTGENVTISNVTINQGNVGNQSGVFTGGTTGTTGPLLGIANGVVLVTGDVTSADGPNKFTSRSTGGEPGPTSTLLSTIDSGTQHDTVTLQFNVVPSGNTLSLDYVFGSEEYNEYVCTTFNDAVGIFVSGPGIMGEVNIARIDQNSAQFSINQINRGTPGYTSNNTAGCDLTNSQFFVNNIDNYNESPGATSAAIQNNYSNVEYDGLTKPLSATLGVQPNQPYTIKVVTADIGDAQWDGAVFLDLIRSYNLDYGDAPNSYKTTGVNQAIQLPGPARHSVDTTPLVYLGSVPPDVESNGTPATAPNAANGDDSTGDDEDVFSDTLTLSSGITSHTISNIPVRNTSSKTAKLMGWIDFNQDGDFIDTGEQATANVAANQTNADLNWSGFTSLNAGNTYARFRITTDTNLINAPSSDGLAIDGEVEDYKVAIASDISPFVGQLVINEILYNETANGAAGNDEFIELYNTSSSSINLSGFKLIDGNLLVNDLDGTSGSITGNQSPYVFPNGTVLLPGQYAVIWIGRQTPERLASGATFQAWLGQVPKLRNDGDDVWLYDANTKIIDYMAYGSSSSGAINTRPNASLNLWNIAHQFNLNGAANGQSISLTPNGRDLNTSACWEKTAILNTDPDSASGRCTGFLNTIDTDVAFISPYQRITSVGRNNNQIIQDYGDAPTGYEGTNSARHALVSSLRLGDVAPDHESAAQSSANADGDDTVATPNIDDEDAINSFPVLKADSTSYSLTAKVINPGDIPAKVYGWIDFDRDNEFDEDERGTVSSGTITLDTNGKVPTSSSGTVNLTWNALGGTGTDITDGNSFIRLRLTTDNLNLTTETTARDDASIGSAINGEVEDYRIAIAQATDPKLLLVKRITAINLGQPGEIQFNNFIDDPGTTNDNNSKWPDPDGNPRNNTNAYLRGEINVPGVKPADEVEYTVYFLSSGDENAKEIKICDVVPDHMTFVKNTYGVELGIGLGFNSTVLPTSPNLKLSNLLNDDQGDFYGTGTTPPEDLCKKVTPANSLVNVNGTNNDNGAVVVKIQNLPKANSPGSPTDSYGFIRFRGKVK